MFHLKGFALKLRSLKSLVHRHYHFMYYPFIQIYIYIYFHGSVLGFMLLLLFVFAAEFALLTFYLFIVFKSWFTWHNIMHFKKCIFSIFQVFKIFLLHCWCKHTSGRVGGVHSLKFCDQLVVVVTSK